LTGSVALGLDALPAFLKRIDGSFISDHPTEVTDSASLNTQLTSFIRAIPNQSKFGFFVVPGGCAWDAEWVAATQTRLAQRTTQSVPIKVIFVANPDRLQQLLSTSQWRRIENLHPTMLHLERWTDNAVRRWAMERELLSFNQEIRSELESLTGFSPSLLHVLDRSERHQTTGAAVALIRERIEAADWPLIYRHEAGIPDAGPIRAVLETTGELEPLSASELAAVLTSEVLLREAIDSALEYCVLLRLIRVDQERLSVYPDVRAALYPSTK
jgi:hypothetical protein